jgi:hypothetical protein
MQTSSGNPSDSDELAGFEGWLARSLYRFDCPDAHTLGEYALDYLSSEERTRIAQHAAECELCQEELRTLRAFLAAPTRLPDSLAERARRRLATLFEPGAVLAYGLRGTAEASTRVYTVDGITITIAPGPESGALLGLVVSQTLESEQLAGRQARLVPTAGLPTVVALDDLGNFEVNGLRPGLYALELDLPDDLVVVEELHVD